MLLFISADIVWIMQPDRILHVDESWWWRTIWDKRNGSLLYKLLSSLLSPQFAQQNLLELSICVSILFSRHLSSSGFLTRPGFPWRQEIPGRWRILKDSCNGGYSTSDRTNDPPRQKSEWKKRILVECSSPCQEVTSAVGDMLVQQPQNQPCATSYTKPCLVQLDLLL